ncbi:MAG TPA: right-handed parallel beta-helix repeat-containing protein, partial [Saprospiraceae bacterium]|nr:right-handed parallel beta-helix repeat-containing protein [Saprospiraceae bacterium]
MRILLTFISIFHLLGLQAAAYYISPNGKDNHAGNRWFVPFRTFERAVSALRPGDTLNIMKGDYFSDAEAIIDIDKSGRENAWIVVKNYLNHKPVLHVKTKYGVRLKSANYVSIEGLQIKPESFYGGNQPVSDAELTGIFLDGSYGAPCRHIKIYNNYVLNFSGAGLLARYYDYLILSYNKFFRNGIGDNTYGAIYLDLGLNTDEKEIYHNFIQANTLEKNSLPDSGKTLPCKPFLYMRFDSAQAPHRDARTLIHNNIAYTNGGGGILIEQATGVRIVHNTLYKNARQATCDWPEVEIRNCRNIDVQNNIFYPFDEKTASRVVLSDSVRFRNNLNYNTGLYVKGMNDVRTDPQFEDIREKENLFNFRLKGNSPAINA